MLKTHHYYHRRHAVTGHWLVLEQLRQDGEVNYRIDVVKLYESEHDLSGGRFARYLIEPQPYSITLDLSTTCKAATEQRIEWITEHIEGAWNVDVESEHTSHAEITYSFAEARDAMLFKLTFGLDLGFAH